MLPETESVRGVLMLNNLLPSSRPPGGIIDVNCYKTQMELREPRFPAR